MEPGSDLQLKNTSISEKKMRYFIFYPPSKTLRLIDVNENDRVEDILELIKKEYGLKYPDHGSSETTIVLSYNGNDLKSKWTFGDLNISSGSIIRCISKQQTAADLYIHCGFNKQIFKLFDSSITNNTSIGTLRKKISDKLGLPLSTFCLETHDGKKSLYDEMKLFNYDIKIHDHVYLKVWQGYEKFINACVKGFTEHYSHDDLIRHYQTQVALHIAAFYNHTDLARSVMEQGARSDRPVGEHPSRQWSSETSTQILPEMLKCPIHVAIERGHIKMVDLFVRQSVLCTQVRDPITNHVPFQLANSYLLSAKTKEEKQRYNEIYFYLKDKQYNLKIPLNATGEYVSNLLSAKTTANTVNQMSIFFRFVSLPLYCKIISWYERARERAWKKYGGRFYTTTQTKRVYPETGLLGYKVLIDGYNNKFEIPIEQLRGAHSNNASKSDQFIRYIGFSDEEREKIIQTKAHMKQFALDERRRAKQIAVAHLQQSRRPPLLLSQASTDLKKHPIGTECILSSSAFSNSQVLSTISGFDIKPMKSITEIDNSSVTSLLQSTVVNPNRLETSHESKEKTKQTSKIHQRTSYISVINEENKHTLPMIHSSSTHSISTNKLDAVVNANKQVFQPKMSSVDAYLASSSRLDLEIEQNKPTKTHNEQSTQQQSKESIITSTNPLSNSLPVDRASMLDLDFYIPLPDHPNSMSIGPIKSHIDLDIRQSTINSYERYASASTRSTAIDCLQEASFFKKEPWIKKVEICKDMVKHKVQQRIRRANDNINKKRIMSPLRATVSRSSHQSDTIKVN
ncbi:unnamed protein product [Rotaria sp. Silwood1]|nr:unnamed protein product [Rotaria sp. Silwood1]